MPPVQNKPEEKVTKKKRREKKMEMKEIKMLRRVARIERNAEATKAVHPEPKSEIRDLNRPTVSIALPSSILENAQSPELKTYLAGQIARAVCIFRVDEVIIFDDVGTCEPTDITYQHEPDGDLLQKNPIRRSCLQMARILQYLECPQYLRRYFFPLHKDLQYAGLLNPLDIPHHLRQNEDFPFREGVVTTQPTKSQNSSLVNVGLARSVQVNRPLQAGLRVTVKLLEQKEGTKKLLGRVVTPQTPEASTGRYWGYSVRIASSLSSVFTEAPYKGGYDLTVGTSDKGQSVDELPSSGFPRHHHALVVFGGLTGLEGALEADTILTEDDPAVLFDLYLNTCPDQGSRTIRTEEAILITLATIRPLLKYNRTLNDT